MFEVKYHYQSTFNSNYTSAFGNQNLIKFLQAINQHMLNSENHPKICFT